MISLEKNVCCLHEKWLEFSNMEKDDDFPGKNDILFTWKMITSDT